MNSDNMITTTVQYAVSAVDVPTEEEFQRWASMVESPVGRNEEVTIRIVDQDEICELNRCYRKQVHPTNVLAFPAEIPKQIEVPFIGDIVICAPIVAQEAAIQGKSELSHWAHLTLHGILHLQGYNHIDAADAKMMESKEIELLDKLGFPNPYI